MPKSSSRIALLPMSGLRSSSCQVSALSPSMSPALRRQLRVVTESGSASTRVRSSPAGQASASAPGDPFLRTASRAPSRSRRYPPRLVRGRVPGSAHVPARRRGRRDVGDGVHVLASRAGSLTIDVSTRVGLAPCASGGLASRPDRMARSFLAGGRSCARDCDGVNLRERDDGHACLEKPSRRGIRRSR